MVRVPVAALSPPAAMDGGASGSDASGGGGDGKQWKKSKNKSKDARRERAAKGR